MKATWKEKTQTLRALYRDEQGANMVEYILMIAAIALPLLGLLFWFKDQIKDWVKTAWDEVKAGTPAPP